MNTIPLTFNQRQIKRTVLGGTERARLDRKWPISVVLLNRGASHYRSHVFDALTKIGFESVISMEVSSGGYDIENFATMYPSIKFVVPQEKVTIGELINIGVAESPSEYILVLWNDISLSQTAFSPKMLENLLDTSFCIVPTLCNSKLQTLPIQMKPVSEKNSFRVLPSSHFRDGTKTLYSFDYVGLYNREKFIHLGGFDYTIENSYWQNLDLFVRSWLWGESTRISSLLRLQYEDDVQEEDITPDLSYLRFFLKNIAPQFELDHALIPFKKCMSYLSRSPSGLIKSFKYFKDAQNWVKNNQYRFKHDIKYLVEMWESEEK